MRKHSVVVGVVVMLAACGGKKKDEPPPKPFEGPLTVAKVMAAKDAVKVFDAWDGAFAKLQSVVGPPTKIDGKKHKWAAMEGDDCAYFVVERDEPNKVGMIQSPMTVGKDGAIMNRAECLTLVGKGVAAEDPNAPGPRSDGPAYEVSAVVKDAVAARSKWSGKQIRITGNITQMMGDEALVRDRIDSDTYVGCKLDGGAAQPPMRQVVMQGTVDMEESVRGDGTPLMKPIMTKCSVVTLDCKAKVAEMHALFDLWKQPKGLTVKPWPTSDEKVDGQIKTFIDEFNKKVAKATAKDLGKGIKDTVAPLLAACAPAAARYKEIVKSDDGDRLALMQSVGDKFAECDCKGDMEMWLARMYMSVLVATGAVVDKPLRY